MTTDNERVLPPCEFCNSRVRYFCDGDKPEIRKCCENCGAWWPYDTLQREESVVDMAEWVRELLPLAKGYVHANPGIRSTEIIIEDVENAISTFNASRRKK